MVARAALTTIRFAGRRASSTVWFTQPSQGGLRGNRRTGEVAHVIVNTGYSPSDRGGKGGDERAQRAQVRALGPFALAGEGAPHVADAARSLRGCVA